MDLTSENHTDRIRFILNIGVIAIFAIILFALKALIFYLLEDYLFPILDIEILLKTSIMGDILSYIINILNLTLASIFGIKFFNRFVPEKSVSSTSELTLNKTSESEIDTGFNFTGFTMNKFGTQISHAFILLCMVYIPLDCLGYMIPGILDYSAIQFDVFDYSDENYFLFSILPMVGITLILNFFTALREEFTFRELILLNGEKYINSSTAFFYSALAFSYGHFGYILDLTPGLSWGFPLWWGFNALIIGFVSAWYFLKYKKLWPLVLAHLGNNTISSIAIRLYATDQNFYSFTLPYLYGGFIVIGILIYIIKFKVVVKSGKEMIQITKNYVQELDKPSDIFIDLFISLILFLLSMLLIIT